MRCVVKRIGGDQASGRGGAGRGLRRGTVLWVGLAGVLAACLGGQASTAPPTGSLRLDSQDRSRGDNYPDTGGAPADETMSPPAFEARQAQVRADYAKLPLAFEPNQGQTDPQVKFLSRGPGYTLFLTPSEAVLSLRGTADKPKAPGGLGRTQAPSPPLPAAVLRLKLLGANAQTQVRGVDPLPGTVNYLRGKDPARWRTNLPTYAKVNYDEVYEGIDLVYYGNPQRLEYDFVVAPEADPGRIRLIFEGTSRAPRLDEQGDLVLPTALGEARLHKPVVYQEIKGERQAVAGRYVLHAHAPDPLPTAEGPGAGIQVGFEVAAYDRSQPLIIDPVLGYSTYLGGRNGGDSGSDIAVDREGQAYVTGIANSTDFPTTQEALQPTPGGGSEDAFVAKLNARGTALVYSTYLGGSDDDIGAGIAVDREGRAYVTGFTYSTDFPTTQEALQPIPSGGQDAFVAKLNTEGAALVYSTYLGGSDLDGSLGITVDREGRAYVTGFTYSTDFPTTREALQPIPSGGQDAFVAKLNARGAALVYSTYLGGSGDEEGFGIAVDREGRAYVTGGTYSNDFPTEDALQPTPNGGQDAFVAKLNAQGTALVYSTYLGGSGDEEGVGIAVDRAGQAYVTGGPTNSTDFPTTREALQPTFGGVYDAFVAKLNARGTALVYSTYLGGSEFENGSGIAVDRAGQAYVTGYTLSTDFPTKNALQSTFGGVEDAFVTKLNARGAALVYSTYLGGSSLEFGGGIAVDRAGQAYVTGQTQSTDFPTKNALQPTFGGVEDAFVTKIRDCPSQKASQGRGDVSGLMEEEDCR